MLTRVAPIVTVHAEASRSQRLTVQDLRDRLAPIPKDFQFWLKLGQKDMPFGHFEERSNCILLWPQYRAVWDAEGAEILFEKMIEKGLGGRQVVQSDLPYSGFSETNKYEGRRFGDSSLLRLEPHSRRVVLIAKPPFRNQPERKSQ